MGGKPEKCSKIEPISGGGPCRGRKIFKGGRIFNPPIKLNFFEKFRRPIRIIGKITGLAGIFERLGTPLANSVGQEAGL
jgi:hypothetical protein